MAWKRQAVLALESPIKKLFNLAGKKNISQKHCELKLSQNKQQLRKA
ncbi:MAG: hypothetical protein HOD92_00950 [Deltaproteobacteria bacterium]|jgi:hypothetical protein|nr:hypothetical protein [Deltaproteobacteria bacterium]